MSLNSQHHNALKCAATLNTGPALELRRGTLVVPSLFLVSMLGLFVPHVAAQQCQSSSQCISSNPCTTGACVNDACVYSNANGVLCDDDGNECTQDYCVNGECVHPPVDYDFYKNCTAHSGPCGAGRCDGQGSCTPINFISCDDDGNECTEDFCVNGECAHPP